MNPPQYNPISEVEGKPVLVLAHGLGVDHRMWEPQLDEFSASYHVLNWDLPGFGKEPPISFARETPLVATADWLAGKIEAEGLSNVYLVGYSMGSMLALLLTMRHPHLVARLGLVACAARWGGGLRVLSIPIVPFVALFLRQQVKRELYPVVTDPAQRAVMDDMLKLCDTKVMAELLRDLMIRNMEPELYKINVPVLMVGGSDDEIVTKSRFDGLKNGLKDPKVLVIEGARHFLCVTHAKILADAVVSFGLPGGADGNQA